jgi:hypothetical protein
MREIFQRFTDSSRGVNLDATETERTFHPKMPLLRESRFKHLYVVGNAGLLLKRML